MRTACLSCHRPAVACFCARTQPFTSTVDFAMVVHPHEAKSSVGTAWILRRSISNLHWFRSKGDDLETDPDFCALVQNPELVPLLLFPGPRALNLSRASDEEWRRQVPPGRRPVFILIDGTWTQARGMLRKSALLRSLPRVSFETTRPSEYGFKLQPHPDCLSCVEGVHRVLEVLAERDWAPLPAHREHDRMIEIFRNMVQFQLRQEKKPRYTT